MDNLILKLTEVSIGLSCNQYKFSVFHEKTEVIKWQYIHIDTHATHSHQWQWMVWLAIQF